MKRTAAAAARQARQAAHRRRNNAGLLLSLSLSFLPSLAPLAFLLRQTDAGRGRGRVPRRRANANICGRVVMREPFLELPPRGPVSVAFGSSFLEQVELNVAAEGHFITRIASLAAGGE